MFCPKCGGQLTVGADFCENCGEKSGARAARSAGGGVPKSAAKPAPAFSKAGLFAIIGAGALLLIVVLAIVLSSLDKDTGTQNTGAQYTGGQYVDLIKTATLQVSSAIEYGDRLDSDTTYEDVIEKYFTKPEWSQRIASSEQVFVDVYGTIANVQGIIKEVTFVFELTPYRGSMAEPTVKAYSLEIDKRRYSEADAVDFLNHFFGAYSLKDSLDTDEKEASYSMANYFWYINEQISLGGDMSASNLFDF